MRQKIDCVFARLCACFIFFLFLSFSASAQHTVTGKVTNAKDGTPVGYATVTVKNTKVATVTDANGNFTINVPSGANTLVVSSVGYVVAETDATSNNVSVALRENTSSLDEIVVTGYTTQKKKDISGAVAIVDVGEAKKIPATSSEQLLQGQAAGVTVINSGAPGSNSQINIRGITSFGNNDPLVIVDGVQGELA